MPRLIDQCELIVDCEHKTAPTQDTGYPSIRTPNIGKGRLILDGVNHVSEETYEAWTRREAPKPRDLILAREAPIGNVAIIPPGLKVCLGQRTVLIRANRKKLNPQYLTYLILGDEIQGRILSISNGATVHHLNMKDIRELEMPPIPDLAVQDRIASVLSAYDDLIENNTRRIKILEEMAQMIYREWFVNFRFPGHENVKLVDSELGPIPEGWKVRNLFDVADVTYGFPFKSKLFAGRGEGVPVIRIRNIKADFSNTWTTQAADPKYTVRNGDLLVGMDGDFHMGKWAGGEAYLNQRVVRFRPKLDLPSYFLFLALQTPIHHFDSTIVGTTVAHLSDRDLRSVNLVLPDEDVLKRTSTMFDPLFELEVSMKLKNANLRTTRDLLLPKLISGEVPVEAADEAAAELMEQTA